MEGGIHVYLYARDKLLHTSYWTVLSTCAVGFWRGTSQKKPRGSVHLIDGEINRFDSEQRGGR